MYRTHDGIETMFKPHKMLFMGFGHNLNLLSTYMINT